MKEYLGAYCKDRDERGVVENWELTDDPAKLASLPDEDVIFASDVVSLQELLDERHGVTKAGLRKTEAHGRSVYVHSHPIWQGNLKENFADLERHLAECGEVKIKNYYLADLKEELRATDFVISQGGIVRLDPKRANARRKGAKTRQAKRTFTITDIRNFCNKLLGVMGQQLELYHFTWSLGSSMKELLPQVTRIVSFFNATFGENAHRKIAAFQHLRKEWLARPEVHVAAFGDTDFGHWFVKELDAPNEPAERHWEVPQVIRRKTEAA